MGNSVEARLHFLRQLQQIANRIHASASIDEIMEVLASDICALFAVDRLTLYAANNYGRILVSRVKTGLGGFKDLRLPVSEDSIAGFVALTRRVVNVADVYDAEQLRHYSPKLQFLQEVDQRTGYRSRQMLVVPISSTHGTLLGVLQLINRLDNDAFPETIVEGAIDLAQTLAVAFQNNRQSPILNSRYDHLLTSRHLTTDNLEEAEKTAFDENLDLETVLIRDFNVSMHALGDSLAAFFGVPYAPFKPERLKPVELLRNIKQEFLSEQGWVPLEENPEGLLVMATDPERLRASRVIQNIFPKRNIVYRVTTLMELQATLDQFFSPLANADSVDELLSGLADADAANEESNNDEPSAAADNELVRLVNKMIIDAHQQGASDIHIEPGTGKAKTLIRFRKDGVLFEYIEVPAAYRAPLLTRIKIMCDMDISERRKPQDGKISFKKFAPLDIELRVATIPTAGGIEDVVMRILANGTAIPLDKIGLSPENTRRLLPCIEQPYGLFLVCGPTGSGKTTTLHSVLGRLNTPGSKIWTVEDPVEITQKGLRQVQVNNKAGVNFANVMRAFLRADPDVIMVGEMRDPETAATAIEASLTGHLVLSTLHTNSAAESITRLLDMGMDPFSFTDALIGILAQRLARRLCPHCKEAYAPDAAEIAQLLDEYTSALLPTKTWCADPEGARARLLEHWQTTFFDQTTITLQRPRGCSQCNHSGYAGRIGLHELLTVSETLKTMILRKAPAAEILARALDEGMRTLKMDGIEKVLQGLTDLKQVHTACIR